MRRDRLSIIIVLVLALVPVAIILWTQTRPDDNAPIVAGGTLTDISSTTAPGEDGTDTRSGDGAEISSEVEAVNTPTTDGGDVGAVVQPLDDQVTTATTQPRQPTVTVSGTSGRSSPTTTTTTTAAPTTTTTTLPDVVGICVFSNGAVASGIRQSACLGTFTTDPEVARQLSAERRSGGTTTTTTTTPPTSSSTTTTVAPEPTTTTTTSVDVTPSTDAPAPAPITTTSTTVASTTTEERRRGRGPKRDR